MTGTNILCVSHYYDVQGGGIERVARQLASELASSGLSVSWAATGKVSRQEQVQTIPLAACDFSARIGLPFPIPYPSAVVRLARAIRQCDVVIIHDGMYLTSVAAMLLAKFTGRPAILVQHVGEIPMTSPVLTTIMKVVDRCVTRPMLRLAHRIVFISETSARHFVTTRLNQPPVTIFNGVDTQIFRPSSSEQLSRTELGLPSGKPVALFVGRFVEKKGVLRLRALAERRPDIHWAFAGQGPIDPNGWGLQNVSKHCGLSGEPLANLYRASDLLVLPSTSEGFPLVVQEALACGLRIACCDDAARADTAAAPFLEGIDVDIADEEGTLIRAERAVLAALAAPDTADVRETRARFAADRYSWRAAGQHYSVIVQALCGSKQTRAQTHRNRLWFGS